jgi:S-formylglutathione hydrolase FrmB
MMLRSVATLVAMWLFACGTTPTASTAITSKNISSPRVVTRTFASTSLGVSKSYVVYVPIGYSEQPQRRWPVVYFLHGMTQDENAWSRAGNLAQTADDMRFPAIIVMPDGDNSFYSNSATAINYQACMATGKGMLDPRSARASTCVRKPDYEDYIVKDLIADVEQSFRVDANRQARAIAGLSMGGFGAMMLAMRHSDQFSAAASHSGVLTLLFAGPYPYRRNEVRLVDDVASWGDEIGIFGTWFRNVFGTERNNWLAHDPSQLAKSLQPGQLQLYVDCGTEDEFGLYNGASYIHDILSERGIVHTFFLGPGGHNFEFWKRRLVASLQFFASHFART